MPSDSGQLQTGHAQGAGRYFLLGRPLRGGDIVELCCSGGWLTGRFEWTGTVEGPARFHFSPEVGGGGVVMHEIPLPPGAMRWATR